MRRKYCDPASTSSRGGFVRLSLVWLLAFGLIGAWLLYRASQRPVERVASPRLLRDQLTVVLATGVQHAASPNRSRDKKIEDVKAGDHVWAYDIRTGGVGIQAGVAPAGA